MIYRILKAWGIIFFGVKLFFRKIHIKNLQFLPKDKPLILASNHPTGFFEPFLLCSIVPMPLYSLTRGDIFDGKLMNWFLRETNMIPIFRFHNGFSNLKKNGETMDECFDLLKENKTILVFSEGLMEHEKRLRPIKKGTARMAFDTWDKYGTDLDIHIQPVGMNYTQAEKPRTEAMIEFCPPIPLSKYKATYLENPKKAVNELTKDLENVLKQIVIHIERKEDEEFVEQMLEIDRNNYREPSLPVIVYANTRRRLEKKIVDNVNVMDVSERNRLAEIVQKYKSGLQKHGITDLALANPTFATGGKALFLAIGFLPFLIGYVFNIAIVRFGERFAEKKSGDIGFFASVWFFTMLATYVVLGIILIVIGLFVWTKLYWATLIFLCFCSVFALFYYEFYQQWKDAKKAQSIPPDELSHLLKLRKLLEVN